MKALAESGRAADDRGGLSWAVIAGLAREVRFVQANSRLYFLRDGLSVPVADELAAMRPLLADHPLYPFLESYKFDADREPAEYRKRVLSCKPPEFSCRHRELAYAYLKADPAHQLDNLDVIRLHKDDLYSDDYLGQWWQRGIISSSPSGSREDHKNHPHAPVLRSQAIAHADGFGVSKDLLAKWEAETQHPEPLVELGKRALAKADPAAALRLLKRAYDLSPESATATLLAQVYRAKGDEANWLAVLEESLKQPDAGLNHARVRVDVADHFMAKGDYKKAWPYAEAAAKTWAAWAMLCASRCAEGNGDMKAAELWVRRTSERYAHVFQYWYFWCVRTGRGDRDEARQLFEAHLVRIRDPLTVEKAHLLGGYTISIGEPKKAAGLFEVTASVADDVLYSYLAAVLYESADENKEFDRVLTRLEKSKLRAQDKLIDTVGKHLRAKDPPTADEVKRILDKSDNKPAVSYLLGKILVARKEPKRAAALFKSVANEADNPGGILPILAGQALKELEEK